MCKPRCGQARLNHILRLYGSVRSLVACDGFHIWQAKSRPGSPCPPAEAAARGSYPVFAMLAIGIASPQMLDRFSYSLTRPAAKSLATQHSHISERTTLHCYAAMPRTKTRHLLHAAVSGDFRKVSPFCCQLASDCTSESDPIEGSLQRVQLNGFLPAQQQRNHVC